MLQNRRLNEELDRIKNFKPTPGQISALPEKLRDYINKLRTVCDPAGDQAALICAFEKVDELTKTNLKLRGELQRLRSYAGDLKTGTR